MINISAIQSGQIITFQIEINAATLFDTKRTLKLAESYAFCSSLFIISLKPQIIENIASMHAFPDGNKT